MKQHLAFLCCLMLLPAISQAERADRDKPLHLEAAHMAIDDLKKTQTLEGDVILMKGTMVLRAEKIVITEDKDGYQKSVAYASPKGLAKFRQKREGKEDFMEGEAERVEYDARTEIAEFFHRAWVRSGDDQVRGEYIWYDALNEKYTANSHLKHPAKDQAASTRVRAVIQPKTKTLSPEGSTELSTSPNLRSAPVLGTPPSIKY